MTPAILKLNFCEGVTVRLAAGVRTPRHTWGRSGLKANRDALQTEALRKLYEQETGRDADKRFTGGLARAQWEYGLRGTDYWTKDKRQAVLAYTARP